MLTLVDEYKRHPRYSSLMADGYQDLTVLTTSPCWQVASRRCVLTGLEGLLTAWLTPRLRQGSA